MSQQDPKKSSPEEKDNSKISSSSKDGSKKIMVADGSRAPKKGRSQSATSTCRRSTSRRRQPRSKASKSNRPSKKDPVPWTTLVPAKIQFTKLGNQAIDLISEVRKLLNGDRGTEFISVIQASFRKINEFITALNTANNEALRLIDKHTALSSTSEIRNRNYLALSQHISERNYESIVESLEDLLAEVTQILQNTSNPVAPAKKTDDTPVHCEKANEMIAKLPSLHSISQSDGSEHNEGLSSHQDNNEELSSPQSTSQMKPPFQPIVVKKLFPTNPEADPSALDNSSSHHIAELPVYPQSGTNQRAQQSISPIQGDQLQNMLSEFIRDFETKFKAFSENTDHKFRQMSQLQDRFNQQLESLHDNMALVQDQIIDQQQINNEQITRDWETTASEVNNGNVSSSPRDEQAESPFRSSPPMVLPSPMVSPHISPVQISPTPSISYPATDINNILQTLSPFSGNPDEYALFITRFTSLVHNNPGIETIMKHNILLSLLKDEAQDLITTDDLSEESYNNLRNNLELVYNRTADRRIQLMDNFKKLSIHQLDYKQMERDVMRHLCVGTSLKKNGITINDPFVIDIFVAKLPVRIMRSVIKKNRVKPLSFMDTISLVQTLISENRAIDEAEQKKNASTPLTEQTESIANPSIPSSPSSSIHNPVTDTHTTVDPTSHLSPTIPHTPQIFHLEPNHSIDTITVNLSLVSDPDYTLPIIQLRTPSGTLINALVDSGATTSIISKSTAKRLKCPIHEQRLINFKGFISATGPHNISFYKLELLDKNGNIWNTIIPEYNDLPTVIKPPGFSTEDEQFLHEHQIDPKKLMQLKRFSGRPIDLILGNNILPNILSTSIRHILPSGRLVEDTPLGFITHPSPVPNELCSQIPPSITEITNHLDTVTILTIDTPDYIKSETDSGIWLETVSSGHHISDTKLDQLLEQASDLEMLGIEPPPAIQTKKALNDELIQKFKSTATRDDENKVYVKFPFNGKESELKDNYPVAIKRLFALLKQLQNIKDLQAYDEIIQQQLSTGIIEVVPETETNNGPHYYIPHRVVVKQDSLTTKLRIVLDASSHQRNEQSLNDCIFPGPSILKSIVGILLRSRTTPYLLIADLEKAFHQVRLQSEHRNVTKFLWLKDISKPPTPDNIITFRFTRIPFGITASPFLLAVTILLYMALNPHPINDKITQNLYVDNVTFTPSTLQEVLADYRASKDVFRSMHMNLREFMCNDKTILAQIPEEDRAKSSTCKFLGHSWNAEQDTFTIKIAVPPPGHPTKRQLASFQASTFDPLGLIAPIIVAIKSLMAKVHEANIKWKDPIPDHLMEEYEAIRAMFTETTFTVPRQVTPLNGYNKVSLVIFSDATLEHYAMCAYLRFECADGTVESRLIFSKSKVRPTNTANLTIPRMELLGLLIAANAAVTLVDELNIDISSVTFFCDNTSVLHWITHQKSLDPWVQKRVKSIHRVRQILEDKNLQPTFRFVPTNENPADIATRGATLSELKPISLWNNGPQFILLSIQLWPQTLEKSPKDPHEFHCYVLGITILQNPIHHDMPALESPDRNTRYPQRPYLYQSQHMKQFALAAIASDEVRKRNITYKYIIKDHYLDSESTLAVRVPECREIEKDKDGIYKYCNSYVNKKHKNMPKNLIYILRQHKLAELITMDSHKSLLHQGPKDTMRDINQRYWIPKLTALARKIRKHCVTCKRRHGRPYKYPYATELPSIRTQTCRPFQHVGLDYFGPISYKTAVGSTGKLWVMLVTCLITRAVHLEVVPDNTTCSFLLAMRRFIGRRGTPKTILSDNAPAFTLGYDMLNTDIRSMVNSSQTLTCYLASKEIDIKQITPFAPWQGGTYERIVALVKNMLYKTIGRLHLSYIEIESLIIECEGILNSRPITMNPISMSDTEAVRPIDFLLPKADLSLPNHSSTANKGNMGITEKQTREYLKHLDSIRLQLWDEFYNEMYTGIKAPRYKSSAHSTVSPQPDHVVLVETPNLPRYRWPLARIIQLLPSKDGKLTFMPFQRDHPLANFINCPDLHDCHVTDLYLDGYKRKRNQQKDQLFQLELSTSLPKKPPALRRHVSTGSKEVVSRREGQLEDLVQLEGWIKEDHGS
ncbi:unnamed protein product [Caenorhabditis nigoni]